MHSGKRMFHKNNPGKIIKRIIIWMMVSILLFFESGMDSFAVYLNENNTVNINSSNEGSNNNVSEDKGGDSNKDLDDKD